MMSCKERECEEMGRETRHVRGLHCVVGEVVRSRHDGE
jgi:hypothetical protein